MHAKSSTYQEDHRDVKHKGNRGIGEEGEATDTVDVIHCQDRKLGEQANQAVHNRAGRRIVVKRDERIHLELGRTEQTLNHGQTDSLEDDTADLEEEADHDELDLANGGNDDTEDDEGHVAQGFHVRRVDAQGPCGDENSNRCGGLRSVNTCN